MSPFFFQAISLFFFRTISPLVFKEFLLFFFKQFVISLYKQFFFSFHKKIFPEKISSLFSESLLSLKQTIHPLSWKNKIKYRPNKTKENHLEPWHITKHLTCIFYRSIRSVDTVFRSLQNKAPPLLLCIEVVHKTCF